MGKYTERGKKESGKTMGEVRRNRNPRDENWVMVVTTAVYRICSRERLPPAATPRVLLTFLNWKRCRLDIQPISQGLYVCKYNVTGSARKFQSKSGLVGERQTGSVAFPEMLLLQAARPAASSYCFLTSHWRTVNLTMPIEVCPWRKDLMNSITTNQSNQQIHFSTLKNTANKSVTTKPKV